jgi:hypothetical protein
VELVKPQMRLERMVEIQHRGTASSAKLLQECSEAIRRNIESSMTGDSL